MRRGTGARRTRRRVVLKLALIVAAITAHLSAREARATSLARYHRQRNELLPEIARCYLDGTCRQGQSSTLRMSVTSVTRSRAEIICVYAEGVGKCYATRYDVRPSAHMRLIKNGSLLL